jgi:hypothetical protein
MKLSGWKEISKHLKVDPRTAQYREKKIGLPINRLPGKRGGVYSTTEVLDIWASSNKKNRRDIVLNFDPPAARVSICIGPLVGGFIGVLALGRPVPK